MVMNAVFPAIHRSSSAVTSTTAKLGERIKTDICIVHAAGDGSSTVFVWVKNVGAAEIAVPERSDIFFGQEDDFQRIPYVDEGGDPPYWEYEVENGDGSHWQPASTVKFTITLASSPAPGYYFVRVITPSGIIRDHYFSM